MDDYNVNVLSEAKNEYSSRLVTILTPLIIEGIRSIFNEACQLCQDNDEEEKYLMTFQNFLSRVPKWNSTIIEEEKNRILQSSGCGYLDDLITCVHITQLKILTSIRVSQKQKKIDIDIPKLDTFIHKCYINFARKLYQNVYLFEKDLLPLDFQKNNREIELICQECILQVTRDSMPIEKILRAYIDKTVDEEVIEESIEKTVEENVARQMEEELGKNDNQSMINNASQEENNIEINKVEKPELNKKVEETNNTIVEENNSKIKETAKETIPQNINLIIETPKQEATKEVKETIDTLVNTVSTIATTEENKKDTSKISFNDNDSVLDMGTNKSSEVSAPKTVERLEKISKEQNEKRKLEEAEEDEDEDDEKITIMGDTSIKLDNLDIHSLDKEVKLEPNIILDDIEVLT
tara:strand:+ start:7354 stop:8580 length:1227 start_codon:yes stop_codon:yes gene_type:complete